MHEALEPEDPAAFKWKGEKPRPSRLTSTLRTGPQHPDRQQGPVLQSGRKIDQPGSAALARAMPERRTHPRNEFENSLELTLQVAYGRTQPHHTVEPNLPLRAQECSSQQGWWKTYERSVVKYLDSSPFSRLCVVSTISGHSHKRSA